MSIQLLKFGFVTSTALIVAGCATTEKPSLRPVEYSMPAAAPGVYDISQVRPAPTPTQQVRPRYPLELRKAGIGGEGVVLFTVTTEGEVVDAMVVRATDVRFGEAALEAVLKWKFRPAELNGSVVNCRMMVPIMFEVSSE